MGGRRKNKNNADRPLTFADGKESVYGQVVAPLGQGQFTVLCSDSISRIAKARGSLYKTVWIAPNDIVLLSLREGNANRADIVLKYMPKEIKILKDNGYIEDTFSAEDPHGVKIDFDQI